TYKAFPTSVDTKPIIKPEKNQAQKEKDIEWEMED
ncbi:unnamed protein product, partial [marine sediment metagenome]